MEKNKETSKLMKPNFRIETRLAFLRRNSVTTSFGLRRWWWPSSNQSFTSEENFHSLSSTAGLSIRPTLMTFLRLNNCFYFYTVLSFWTYYVYKISKEIHFQRSFFNLKQIWFTYSKRHLKERRQFFGALLNLLKSSSSKAFKTSWRKTTIWRQNCQIQLKIIFFKHVQVLILI